MQHAIIFHVCFIKFVKTFTIFLFGSSQFVRGSFSDYVKNNVNNFVFSICSCCGAGTAADTEYTTLIISANIELHRLETQRKVGCLKMSLIEFETFRFFKTP